MANTIRIRLLNSVTGAYTYAAGDEVTVSKEIAEDLIKAGHAIQMGVNPENAKSKQAANSEKR